MRLAIVAATGGIGRQLLDQAVAAGHDVTAVVRDPSKVADGVRTVAADLTRPDPEVVADAFTGVDAVLSGLGPRRGDPTGTVSTGTRTVTTAMRTAGVRRLVVVSAAPIGTVHVPGQPAPPRHDPGDGFWMRHLATPLVKTMLRAPYADLARMEHELRGADLDWTVVRPPRLTDGPRTDAYRTARDRNVRRGLTVARADVAHCMLHALTDPTTVGHTVGLAD